MDCFLFNDCPAIYAAHSLTLCCKPVCQQSWCNLGNDNHRLHDNLVRMASSKGGGGAQPDFGACVLRMDAKSAGVPEWSINGSWGGGQNGAPLVAMKVIEGTECFQGSSACASY